MALGVGYNAAVSVLGLDLGEKRVGVAIAEPPTYVAVPSCILPARPQNQLISALRRLATERGVKHLVVGLPVELSGQEGDSARACREAGRAIAEELGCSVSFVDERFSSEEAEKRLVAAGRRRADRRKFRDALAAALILDTYLAKSKRC